MDGRAKSAPTEVTVAAGGHGFFSISTGELRSLRHCIGFMLAVTVLVICSAPPALAQKYQFLGRGKCVNCHDHDNEKLWSEKKDGPPPNNHLNALKQMESSKSKAFADATGVKDVYDPGSSCVPCHATVVKGDTAGGVTCESCHGPGSAYLEPHQKKDTGYAASIALGMNDFVKKPQNWAGACMKCHVMDDARLIAAKHPSGDDFDLGAKFSVVATGHWKSTYDKAAIAAAGRAAAAPLIAKRGGRGAPPLVAAGPSSAPPVAVVPPVAAPATAAPAVAPPVTPAAAAPAAPTAPAGRPAAAVAVAPSTPVARPPATSPTTVGRSPAPPTPAAAPPPAPPPTPPPTPVGLPPTPTMTPPPPAATPEAATVTAAAPALPQSPTAAVAEIQGRTITLIDSLLRRGGRAPLRVTPPERKTQYKGADADLLRLQEEVLALAIEALGTAPPAPPAK